MENPLAWNKATLTILNAHQKWHEDFAASDALGPSVYIAIAKALEAAGFLTREALEARDDV